MSMILKNKYYSDCTILKINQDLNNPKYLYYYFNDYVFFSFIFTYLKIILILPHRSNKFLS